MYGIFCFIYCSYFIRNISQQIEHPNPGSWYDGIKKTAYLPYNEEGKEILKLLKLAFKRRLIFTIKRSNNLEREDYVTWGDIPHKTEIENEKADDQNLNPEYFREIRKILSINGIK